MNPVEPSKIFEDILQELKQITQEIQTLRHDLKPTYATPKAPEPIRPEEPHGTPAPDAELADLDGFQRVSGWLATKNITVKNYRQPRAADETFDWFATFLGNRYDSLKRLHEQIKKNLSARSRFALNLKNASQEEIAYSTQFCHRLREYTFLSHYNYDKSSRVLYATPSENPEMINFFTGGWFERFIFLKITDFLTKNNLHYDYLMNAQISLPNGDNSELDLLFLVGSEPLWLECKTGDDATSYVIRYSKIRPILGIPKENAIMVILEIPDKQATGLTNLYDITVSNEKNFLDNLPKLIPAPTPLIPTTTPPCGDMNLNEFRRQGHQLIEWVAGYLEHPEHYSVLSRSRPGEIKGHLPATPPSEPEPLETILADFKEIILPGITHWNHPGFFAYFGISGSAPGILGELLIAALNVNGMLWRTSPAATELEEVTLDWLRQMLGLPAELEGVIMDTASISSLVAIAAAREALGLEVRSKGLAGRPDLPRLRLYISDQTHSSVEKGAITLGIGQENVIKIGTNADFRLRSDLLVAAIEADLAAGYCPFFICGTVGTTSSTSIDPLPELAAIAERYHLWFHVDGAYGGIAGLLPEKRHLLAGAERADSIVVNPHKWLFTPIDLSAFYTRHPTVVKQAFSLTPEYLRTAEGDTELVKNYMDYGVQLGRRFRALKLWMVIRTFGAEGLAARIREHIRLAAEFAAWVDASPHFERTAPTPLSTVCFRAHPSGLDDEAALERLNEALLNAVNDTGEIFISHTKLHEKYTLRLAIGNIRSTERHVARAWELLQQELARLNQEQHEQLVQIRNR
jgi:aromatic-L-amino-acid decarboxylase